MERITTDVETFHLGVADLDAFLVDSCVEGTLDFEPGLCRRRRDQLDDGGTISERPAAPILGDAAEQAMLDLVPLMSSVQSHPATLAPAGSPRSGSGGDEWSEALWERSLLGISGTYWPQQQQTSLRPRKDQCESRPTSGMGRSPPSGKRARHAPDGLTGVKMAARMTEHQSATREVCRGDHGRQTGRVNGESARRKLPNSL